MIGTLIIALSVPVGWCLGRLTLPRWWWFAGAAWLVVGLLAWQGQPWALLVVLAAAGVGWWRRGRHTVMASLGESVMAHPGGPAAKWRALRRGIWLVREWPQLTYGAGLHHAGQWPALVYLAVVPDGCLISAIPCDGQTIRDWTTRGDAIASALGVRRVTVSPDPVRARLVHVQAADSSPLATVTVRSVTQAEADGLTVEVGLTEAGEPMMLDVRRGHMLLVGGTGAGKSTLAYRLATAWAADPLVRVVAVDPSQLLGAPFAEAGSGSVGEDGPQGYMDVLSGVVGEMDRRLATLREARTDNYASLVDVEHPWLVVLVDEAPGLITALEMADRLEGRKPAERWATQVQAHIRRLLLEGRKAGIRVVIAQQRADIDGGLLSGAARDQAATQAVVLRSQPEGVRMLLPGVGESAPDYVARLPAAPPGVCLVQVPGQPLMWARTYAAPSDEDYRWWHDRVTGLLADHPQYPPPVMTGSDTPDETAAAAATTEKEID